jgi:hypothetical protein
MVKPHPRYMAHREAPKPAAPTRLTVSGGPKAEPHLSQPTPETSLMQRLRQWLRGRA